MSIIFTMRWHCVVIPLFVYGCGASYAQTVPAAINADQELLRQQERENQLRRRQEPRPNVQLQAPAPLVSDVYLKRDEVPCFVIHRIVLTGSYQKNFSCL